MDIDPSNISPAIVEIAKRNPMVKEIFTVYLHEIPIIEGEPMTWRDALESMVIKLDEQYRGALEGWKSQSLCRDRIALVNENESPCPECNTLTWYIPAEGGNKRCAVCEARRGRRNLIQQKNLMKKTIAELIAGKDSAALKTIRNIIALEPAAAKE